MKELIGFPPQLIKNTLGIADKIDVTDGYIPVAEIDFSAPRVVGLLSSYSPTLRVKFKPRSRHITVSLIDHKSADVLEHLRQQLLDYDLVHFTEYDPWTPRSIYSSVLKTMKVPEEKIKGLCGLIPSEAQTLREAVLLSTDFSCLSSEDYVCSLAAEICDTLISTFKEEGSLRHNYALTPKGMAVPIVRDYNGKPRCQYDFDLVNETGLISIELQP